VQAGEKAVDDPPGDDLDATEGSEACRVEEVGARGAVSFHGGRKVRS
jgi:hypothetical protein